ncbi:hypothetical protein DID75_05430 [Candidatus Marinamargulisbacteria bacterium SCGC AG-410-N11]|nr:hypothetical protein DID75_05430 [Candidatus Marinamargulisbacteria bacterium SCGC AG-410-N11]
MTSPMHICFFSHSSDFWGAEQSLLDTLTVFKQHNIECTLVCPKEGQLPTEAKKLGIRCLILGYEQWVSVDHPIVTRTLRTFRNYIRAKWFCLRYKHVKFTHCYTNSMTINIGALVAKQLKIDHIWHIREYGLSHHNQSFDCSQKKAYSFIVSHTKHLVAVSHAVASVLKPYTKKTIHVIRNIVPLKEAISPITLSESQWTPLQCVMLGHINPSKNQLMAIQAVVDLITKKNRAITLTIIGGANDNYRNQLNKLIQDHQLQRQIKLIPFTNKPLDYLNKAHVLIVTSKFEASPRIIVEAMRLSKPVIVNDSGGAPELVQESGNGLIYNYQSNEELKAAIDYAYKNPADMIQKGKKGYDWVTTHLKKQQYMDQLIALLKT